MAYRIYLCGCDDRVYPDTSDCPNSDQHEPEPRGYGDWFDWAKRMGKTHRQAACEGCGLLKIWEPKAPR